MLYYLPVDAVEVLVVLMLDVVVVDAVEVTVVLMFNVVVVAITVSPIPCSTVKLQILPNSEIFIYQRVSRRAIITCPKYLFHYIKCQKQEMEQI